MLYKSVTTALNAWQGYVQRIEREEFFKKYPAVPREVFSTVWALATASLKTFLECHITLEPPLFAYAPSQKQKVPEQLQFLGRESAYMLLPLFHLGIINKILHLQPWTHCCLGLPETLHRWLRNAHNPGGFFGCQPINLLWLIHNHKLLCTLVIVPGV